MNIRMKSNDEQQSSFIRKTVPPARMGLDGFPMWERGAEKT